MSSRLATIFSRAQQGIDAPLVTVEVYVTNGLPGLSIVGLPETAVKESKDRVRGALLNSQFEFPPRRITVNLAPADLPKEGGRFDLPIALGILVATDQIQVDGLDQYEFIGELALSGEIRSVRGCLPAALQTKANDRTLVFPAINASETALISELKSTPATHLLDLCAHLTGIKAITAIAAEQITPLSYPATAGDLADIKGQEQAKRALEVAAAGGHNLLFSGPPGTGKSMLASRLPGILPPMSEDEALETFAVYSISSHQGDLSAWNRRPFRSPHHTVSAVALVGGSSQPKPGEISLAHNGILFLDELPEFDRKTLEAIREPMETGEVHISRASSNATFPANFQLIAAMNPCPCGFLGDSAHHCSCTPAQIDRYRSRLSGPFLDRIDLHVNVPRVPYKTLFDKSAVTETSEQVRARVIAARQRQLTRSGKTNSQLTAKELDQAFPLDQQGHKLMQQAMEKMNLSPRTCHRLLRLALTLADLESSSPLTRHLKEALSYRPMFNA